jgi:nitroreductase
VNSIFKRRSIRKYLDSDVSDEMVEEIIKAGMAAPSAGDERPWHFIVVRNKSTMLEFPKFHQYAQMLKNAPVAIVVCGDLNRQAYEGFWIQDCSAAIQNMLLQVTEMGLGSVWVGIYPDKKRVEKTKELLDLPENIVPVAVLPIGAPGEIKPVTNRYDKRMIHLEKW